MSIQNAMNLLNRLGDEPSLRSSFYRCERLSEVKKLLADSGYSFSFSEFEDSVNMLHVRCQSIEQADLFLEKAQWFRMVLSSVQPDITDL